MCLRKRDHIRKLIYKIVRDNAKGDASSANNHNCLSRASIGTIIRWQQTFRESKFFCGDSMGPSTFQIVSMEQSSNPTSPIEVISFEQLAFTFQCIKKINNNNNINTLSALIFLVICSMLLI